MNNPDESTPCYKNNTVLKSLPPTEDAFMQHLKCAALATIIDKTAHQAEPNLPSAEDYGWTLKDGIFVPITMATSSWPQDINKGISCGCKTVPFCSKNCACGKQSVACYIGCKCKGSPSICSRAMHAENVKLESDDSNSDSSDGNEPDIDN